MIGLLLATSLWAVSYQERPVSFDTAVTVPVEKIADSLAVDFVANGFGTAGDLISTDWGLQRGCVEANPLGQRVEGRVALKVGGAFFRGGVAYLLRRHGHKRAADVWRWVGVGVDSWLTISNIRCGLRDR